MPPFRSTAIRLLVPALIVAALAGLYVARVKAASITQVDLSTYSRVGRYDLPEPKRTAAPPNSLLAQEASGVTFNWDTNTLFVVGDGGTSVVEVSKTGALLSSMTLTPGSSPQGTEFYDTEGIAYMGGGKFVLIEERYRQANLFTYIAGGVLHRADVKTVKLGTTIGNIGLEGVTWDPMTGGYIFTKEKDPESIFQTSIDFNALTASNGSPTADESVNLFDPALANVADFSDVFALSNLPDLSGQPDFSHLLIISQESGQIINVDRAGKVYSKLTIVADPGSPLSVADMTMEGVTMDRDGILYVVNENGGGDADHPQLWVYAHSTAANKAPTAVTLANAVSSIPQNASTAAPVKMADILVADDGLGNNNLTVTGADAASFQIIGTALFLKTGTVLDSVAKPSYSVTVNVDDPTVGNTPDATVNFRVSVTGAAVGTASLIISEVASWSSGNSPLAADWFEVTNIGSAPVDVTGWKMDDNSNSFGLAVPMSGITSIAAGESVIFIESDSPATVVPAFKSLWFGASPPARLQIGTYSGSGVGLSTGGDAVNLYNTAGVLQASVTFDVSPAGPSYPTFDNSGGLNNSAVALLSAVGINGAFTAPSDAHEIGSPGSIGPTSPPTVTIIATDPNAAESGRDPGTFRFTRSGSTVSALNVNYTIATGAGQATSADYTPALTGSAIIPAGQSFLDITITPVDDTLVEGPEKVTLTLNDTGSYDVGAPGTATITIADNDVSANKAPTAVVLNNTVTTITQDTSTVSAIKVADIAVTDDGLGTNTLSLTGVDAASFQIVGSALYLKAGTTLNAAAKASYSVTVNVDDPTVGSTPDATVAFTLTVLAAAPATGSIVITEVAPWSSSSPIAADWFEVTNTGAAAVNIAGWKMDDNSNSFSAAVALNGITSIAPGESVIFLESDSPATIVPAFKTLWFGANPPVGLQVGTYTGSGVGLSTTSDAVNLFNAAGVLQASVTFGASPAGPSLPTFDNGAGLDNTAISQLSVAGIHNAAAAVNDPNEIGSPGTASNLAITEVAPWSSSSPVAADWFEVTNTGAAAVNIAGWKIDDNSNAFSAAVPLSGITSIAPGESVIFLESDSPATVVPAFKTLWFGANPPAGLQVGTYSGSGVGLSTSSDAVNLYNAAGVLQASVNFGASPAGPALPTFDNAAALGNVTLLQKSAAGVHGGFAAKNDANEIGSPGSVGGVAITEVAPWSSSSPVASDWFEVTNTSAHAVDLTGWKMDDNSNSFALAVPMSGVTSIAPGESVIFLESDSPATVVPAFKTLWFGANPPAGLQVGTYSGSGVGLSTTSDAVNLYNSAGVLQASVTFGASPAGPSLPTFENAGGLNNATLTQLSAAGVHNAAAAANDANEIGSPGTSGNLLIASVKVAGGGDQSAPNTWLEIKGQGLAPSSTAGGLLWSKAPEFAQGKMPTTLGGISATVNGHAAYIYYVSPTQVNILTSLDTTTGPVDVILKNGTATSAAFTVVERAASPAFFLFGATQYVAATHADFSYLGPASLSAPGLPFTPARPSETIVLWANGFGLPTTALTEGSSTQSSPLPELPVVQIGGATATVSFAGVVTPGLYQINVTVPASVPDGDNAVSVSYKNVQTPIGALLTVKR